MSRLVPYANNARTHSRKQIRQIADSIRHFGFTNPVLVADDDTIIAGHGRVEAAKLIGMTEVPIRRLSHLTRDEVQAYILADNRLAENAGWDRDLLAVEMQSLIDLDFDIEALGFSTTEIDLTIGGEISGSNEPDRVLDAIEPVASGPAVTLPGNLWCSDLTGCSAAMRDRATMSQGCVTEIAADQCGRELKPIRQRVAMRDVFLLQSVLEERLTGAPQGDHSDVPVKETAGNTSLVFAHMLNDSLPKRFQMSISEMMFEAMRYQRLTKRELLKTTRLAWVAIGQPKPRGAILPPWREVGPRMEL